MSELAETRVTLYSLARDAYRNAGGNITAAKEAIKAALADPEIVSMLADDILASIANTFIANQATQHRNRILNAAPKPTRANVLALATGISHAILDFPIAGGVKLRDASRDELRRAIDHYSAMSAENKRRADWLTAILQMVPDGKCAGDVLTEERAADLWTSTGLNEGERK